MVLVGGRLIVGDGTAPIDNAVVITDDSGLITYVGGSPSPPAVIPTARVLDVSGCTVMPGFFDCHIHFHLDGLWGMHRRQDEYPPVHVFETAARMRETLYAGVTSARDLGGTGAGFRVAQERGLLEGPRLQVALRLLSHTGGHADMTCKSGHDLVRMAGEGHEICDTPAEARLSVRRVLRDGADLVKVCATGGISTPADQPEDEGLSEEEIATVVDEARRHRRRRVAAHAQGAAGIINAIRGGVTSIEHGYLIDDEGMDLALERGVFVVPTLSAFSSLDRGDAMSATTRQTALRIRDETHVRIAAAIERGVKIAAGTDAPAGRYGHNLEELERLVGLGMSPMDAIVAGTATAADLCGVSDILGTVETGKIADLAICAGDPLSGISALSNPDNIRLVIQGGRVVKDTDRRASQAVAPAR
ncbi:metal-dependent hydrolase family protein [Sphaerimonospora cavernae]|uniref:metal-dependent hydrolase family protein n=1 Tax=Sphaerimonospora cavernae TaxID=1740611 RepID=UPI00373FD993